MKRCTDFLGHRVPNKKDISFLPDPLRELWSWTKLGDPDLCPQTLNLELLGEIPAHAPDY